MATASDIGANFSNYRGDEALGGGTLGAFKLDTQPLQDFARYTMLYNREEQEQKQKEAEKAAAELGKIADYNLTSSIPKDAKVLQQKYDNLISYVKQNPGALQFKNRDQWLKYQQLKSDLNNDITGAKTRNIMNMARQKEIADEPIVGLQDAMKADLQKEIDAKDIRTPLFFTQQMDITVPDFGKNAGQSIEVMQRLPNEIYQTKTDIFDAAEADRHGAAVAVGADFDKTTERGKRQDILFKNNVYVKGAELLNNALGQAKADIDPTLDAAAQQQIIKQKISGVGLARDMVSAVEQYNNYVSDIQKRFKAGELSGNGVNPDAYTPIEWQDGLSPVELSKVAQFIAWQGDKKETKVITTNDANEKARIGLGYANLALQQKEFEQKKTQYEDALKGTEVEKNAALAFAQNLFTDLGSLASRKTKEGGFLLSTDDVRKLTTDQLKYLGLEIPPKRDEDGKVIESGGLNPLQLGASDILSVDPNGTVRVMKNAKFNSAKDQWEGEWDNTRSTSIWNAATNRLNEENIKAAGKERNAYLPIDLRGKDGVIQVDTSGGETKKKTTTTESAIKGKTKKGLPIY